MDSLLGAVLAAGIVANAVILGLLVLQAGRQARTGGAEAGPRSIAQRPRAPSPPEAGSDGRAYPRRAGDPASPVVLTSPVVPASPMVPAARSPTGSASVVGPRAPRPEPRPDPRHPTDEALARAIEAFVGSGEGDREGAASPSSREPAQHAEPARVAEAAIPAEPAPGARSTRPDRIEQPWDPARSRASGASPGTASSGPGSVRIRIVIERLDRIADRLGPAVAERVLDQVVSGIAAASRSSDRVTRLTGATIEIGLEDTNAVAADRYAERARRLCDDWFEGSALGLRATVLPAAPEGDDAAGRG